ncbi:hypothetical protein FOCC_FOCC014904 [Frankliniella occidentalis]|nr:hypothetical protein FOCC_FOCC014904 [Frankliniella occidentalis]
MVCNWLISTARSIHVTWSGTPAHPPLAVGEVLPAPPVVQAAPPAVQAAPPVVQAAPPVVEAAPPVVEAAPPVVEAAPPVVEAAPPVVEAAPPVVQPEQQDFLKVYQLLPDGKMIELSNSDLFDESVFTPNTPKRHDEARPEVICISSSDEEPASVAVKDEDDLSDCTPLADTPVRPKREKVLHTPPSGSGLTPAFKRRLERMANSSKLGDSSVDLKTLVKQNTEAMENLLQELRRFKM